MSAGESATSANSGIRTMVNALRVMRGTVKQSTANAKWRILIKARLKQTTTPTAFKRYNRSANNAKRAIGLTELKMNAKLSNPIAFSGTKKTEIVVNALRKRL